MYNLIAKPSSPPPILPFLYYPQLITVRIIVVTSSIVEMAPSISPEIPTRETDAVIILPRPPCLFSYIASLSLDRPLDGSSFPPLSFCSQPFFFHSGRTGNLVEWTAAIHVRAHDATLLTSSALLLKDFKVCKFCKCSDKTDSRRVPSAGVARASSTECTVEIEFWSGNDNCLHF